MAVSFASLSSALDSVFGDTLTKSLEVSTSNCPANQSGDAAVTEALNALLSLSTSKGKEEAPLIEIIVREPFDVSDSITGEFDSVDSDSIDEADSIPLAPPAPPMSSVVMVKNVLGSKKLPPPPSAFCDCHGLEQCPGFSFCCSICMDDFVPGELRKHHSPNCHTYCCEECLKDTLAHSVCNGNVTSLSCPSCGYHMTTMEVARRLDDANHVEKYHRFLLRKMLSHQDNLHECGNPGCENAVLVDEGAECALKKWTCDACQEVCPFCKEASHPKSTCAAERKFKKAEVSHKLWTTFSLSKKCPGCKTPIIKNGGCPHMTCKNPGCGAQWCWHCKKDWKKHDMCVYEKAAVVGLVVISPVIVSVAIGAAVVIAAPLMAANGLTGCAIFDGKALIRKGWKYSRRLYDEFF